MLFVGRFVLFMKLSEWYHIDVNDSLGDDSEIDREMDVMDERESRVILISVSLKELSSPAEPTIKTESMKVNVVRQCLADLEANILRINGKIRTVTPGPSMDCSLLERCNKQVIGFEIESLDAFHNIAAIEDAKELADE